jgi:hypothetical protein
MIGLGGELSERREAEREKENVKLAALGLGLRVREEDKYLISAAPLLVCSSTINFNFSSSGLFEALVVFADRELLGDISDVRSLERALFAS